MKEQIDAKICRLREGFEALTTDHKKGVLKTAQRLLRIQRAQKTTVTDNILHDGFSLKGKDGYKTR